ncbi:MAG: TonB-dependent receptor [Bryobacterales bacterium]
MVPPLAAQTGGNTGLSGTVTDPSGAGISNASLNIARTETGEERILRTDAYGNWEARYLTTGTYTVTVEAENFQALTVDGVQVKSGEVATLPLQLGIGQQSESVTVTADAEMVSRTSAAIVRELDARELENLPTSSRNFTQLLLIEPGVDANISSLLSNDNANVSPSVNGQRTTSNSFLFNGVDATNMLCCDSRINRDRGTIEGGGGSLSRNIAPAPETLAEVKLQTSLYDASTGRNGGGSFQLVSKSGSNQFHGSVYHFFQNDNLIANDFFFNRAGLDKQQLQRNEGGFIIGGPIVREKTFFFGSYQHTKANTAFVDEASNTVRMPQALSSDRSTAGLQSFADALGANPDALNATSVQLLQATLPDGSPLIPSGAGGRNCEEDDEGVSCQVTSVSPATYRQDQFSANLDHYFETNRLSGKFFFANQPSRDPFSDSTALSRFEEEENTRQRVFSVTDTHFFSPTIINEFRGGVFFNRNDTTPVVYFSNAEFGINSPLAGERPELASFVIEPEDVGSDFIFGTPENLSEDKQTTFTLGDTLSIQSGRHFLRFGGEYRRHRIEGDYQETKNVQYGLESWAQFLTVGEPDDGDAGEQIAESSISYGETFRDFRLNDVSFFIADDWKVNSKLTLNLGLRYDFFGWPTEASGLIPNFDLSRAASGAGIAGGYIFAGNFDSNILGDTSGLNRADTNSTLSNDTNNFAPRIGFAYSPFASKGFVIRGGYGFYYDRPTGGFINALRRAPPFFREQEINDVDDWNVIPVDRQTFPLPQFQVGFDDGEPFLATAANPDDEFEALEAHMMDLNLRMPYIQQWNLGFQVPLASNTVLELGYVGTKGTRLFQRLNKNVPVDVNAVGFLERPGVPGGGFTSNYFDIVDDEFVPVPEPPCDVFDDYEDCTILPEVRGPILGFDEDEGLNMVTSDSNSTYHALQASLSQRYTAGLSYKINYTWSKVIDYFSDEGLYQAQHDQSRVFLNRAAADFDRTHRLVFSFTYDLPFRGNAFAEGWSLSGIGTLQTGRPFSITDSADFSGFLSASTEPRPNIVSGATYEDLETSGSASQRVGNYINRDLIESSGAHFGNLGRNILRAPSPAAARSFADKKHAHQRAPRTGLPR